MNTGYNKMKRIVWVNPASLIKSLQDLMSGPLTPISMIKSRRDLINRPFGQILLLQNLGLRRENVNAFSRLIKMGLIPVIAELIWLQMTLF